VRRSLDILEVMAGGSLYTSWLYVDEFSFKEEIVCDGSLDVYLMSHGYPLSTEMKGELYHGIGLVGKTDVRNTEAELMFGDAV
jgi:hypothetical protein